LYLKEQYNRNFFTRTILLKRFIFRKHTGAMDKKRKEKTVLIIEDEVDIRSFIARVLELEGYNVLEASDGTRGMEIIRENKIALVLLDLRLPGPDGWSVLREIKHNPELAGIPVVVITAIAETIQRKKTLRMGATSYLVKPLSARSLSLAIAGILQEKSHPYQTV
jgi:DNA-binding response OmpR family regulator